MTAAGVGQWVVVYETEDEDGATEIWTFAYARATARDLILLASLEKLDEGASQIEGLLAAVQKTVRKITRNEIQVEDFGLIPFDVLMEAAERHPSFLDTPGPGSVTADRASTRGGANRTSE